MRALSAEAASAATLSRFPLIPDQASLPSLLLSGCLPHPPSLRFPKSRPSTLRHSYGEEEKMRAEHSSSRAYKETSWPTPLPSGSDSNSSNSFDLDYKTQHAFPSTSACRCSLILPHALGYAVGYHGLDAYSYPVRFTPAGWE